jgi:DNA-binding cell septation regulator SpoVG
MANFNFNKGGIIGIIGGVLGLLGLGYGAAMHTKVAKVSKRLDTTIDDLANNMNVDISEAIVNEAIEKHVAAETKKAVEKATSDAMYELKKDIRNNVSEAVNKEYETIKDTVLAKVTEEASKIDVARVQQSCLDAVLKKYNDGMDNVSKIYNTLANTASKLPDKEFTIRLG